MTTPPSSEWYKWANEQMAQAKCTNPQHTDLERRLDEALAALKFYGKQGGATQSLWNYGERARAVLASATDISTKGEVGP